MEIDPDVEMHADPGKGAGIFVEYQSGGHWHVWTTCASSSKQNGCTYDVTAQTLGTSHALRNVRGDGLELGSEPDYDYLQSLCDDTAALTARTSDDVDGFFFDTDDGAGVRFQFWVEAVSDPAAASLVYYVQGGVQRRGAPANPIDLLPGTPGDAGALSSISDAGNGAEVAPPASSKDAAAE